jgi:hypothetical protein
LAISSTLLAVWTMFWRLDSMTAISDPDRRSSGRRAWHKGRHETSKSHSIWHHTRLT